MPSPSPSRTTGRRSRTRRARSSPRRPGSRPACRQCPARRRRRIDGGLATTPMRRGSQPASPRGVGVARAAAASRAARWRPSTRSSSSPRRTRRVYCRCRARDRPPVPTPNVDSDAMSIDTPDWVRDAVFYQVFPDRFASSDARPQARARSSRGTRRRPTTGSRAATCWGSPSACRTSRTSGSTRST